jgi:serine/threonine protein phosphatase PrpC
MVPEVTIADVLRAGGRAQANCETLVNLALEAGGLDNITVAVARYRKTRDK